MSEAPSLEDFLRCFSAAQGSYPGGIPRAEIEAAYAAKAPAKAGSKILFVGPGPAAPADVNLLKAAVEKGLKLPNDDAGVFFYSADQAAEAEKLALARKPKVIVWFNAGKRGTWEEISGVPVIFTHPLSDSLGSAQIKKEFWLDLQQVLAKLGEMGK